MTLVDETAPGVVALLLDDLAPPRLGAMLRAARKQRADTRRDVANRIGISPNKLRRYEHGDAPVPSSVVAALAECYGEDLTAQFAMRASIHIEDSRIVVGDEDIAIESEDADGVLGTYVEIISRLRQSEPGEPIALRTDDLLALSSALGQEAGHVEARIVELLGCTPREARSLHAELLRRKLVLPVAGLVTGLAVVAGIGVASASPNNPAAPAPVAVEPAGTIARVVEAPTTVAPAPTTTPAPEAEPAPTVAPEPSAPAVEPTEAVAPVAEPAATLRRPVVEPDNTPMAIPANETVTIIQP